jgi:hypothetical protein
LGVVSGLLSMTARPTPNGEPTTDPWQWLHDNEFSWDDVNAVAAIFELGGWDVVKSEARATAPAGLDALRELSEAATPGPWVPLTHGTASQRDAAGRAFLSVMAVRAPDNPDIEYTDLSWVETADPNGPHIALVGNGPKGPENSKFIVAAVNYVRAALAADSEPVEE